MFELLRNYVNFLKISFKKRFAVNYALALSLVFLGAVPILEVKIIAFFAFIGLSPVFLSIFTSQFISQIKTIRSINSGVKFPVSSEIKEICKKFKVKIKELRFVKGNNAFALGKKIGLGIDLVDKLNFPERQAVVAHEICHIKEHHTFIKISSLMALTGLAIYCSTRFTFPILFNETITQISISAVLNIGLLAFVTMAMVPLNWYLELRADRFAARLIGKENMKSALLKIVSKEKRSEMSEEHPSIVERIKELDKLKEQQMQRSDYTVQNEF